MRIGYMFLANAGEFTPEGKLNVIGGDFNTIEGQAFPYTHVFMALVLKLFLDGEDMGRVYDLRLSVIDSQGEAIVPPFVTSIRTPDHPLRSDRPTGLGFVMNMLNLTFPRPDKYTFRASLQDQVLPDVELYVEQQEAVAR